MDGLQAKLEQFCKSQYLKLSKITDTCYRFPQSSFGFINGIFYLDFFNNSLHLSIQLQNSDILMQTSRYSKFKLSPICYKKSKIIRYKLSPNISDSLELFDEIFETLKNLSLDLKQLKDELVETKPRLQRKGLASVFNSDQKEVLEVTFHKYKKIMGVEPDLWCVDVNLLVTYKLEINEMEVRCLFVGKTKMIPAQKVTFFHIGTGLDVILKHFQIYFNGSFKIVKALYDACEFRDEAVLDEVWEDFLVCYKQGSWVQIDNQVCSLSVSLKDYPKEGLKEMVQIVQFRRMSNRIPD